MKYKQLLFTSLLSLTLLLPITVSSMPPVPVQAAGSISDSREAEGEPSKALTGSNRATAKDDAAKASNVTDASTEDSNAKNSSTEDATAGASTAKDASTEGSTVLDSITETVSISNVKELLEFSQKSTNEAYTRGKRFQLTGNIDLTGTDFTPIAMIAGVFDGNGYTIKGFSYHTSGSETGLIRSVSEHGVVENLTVIGELFPDGLMENIGGIVGENSGIIRNCTFQGSITARKAVGGICGHNLESGSISNCVNRGKITGTRRTAGIAGFNEGMITGCQNIGTINGESENAEEKIDNRKKKDETLSSETGEDEELNDQDNLAKLDPDSLDLVNDNVLESVLTDENKISYTGGIAGISSGTIQSCVNEGIVGYPHVGYNTGGIVGYKRGILTGCTNRGQLFGRKNVGGIIGEFEPYMETIYHEDSMDAARSQVSDMVNMIADLQSKVKTEDDKMQQNADALRNNADNLRQSIKNYKDYYRDLNDNTETEIRSRIDQIREVVNRMDTYSDPSKTIDKMENLQDSLDDLNQVTNKGFSAARQFQDPSTILSYGVRTLEGIKGSLGDVKEVMDALVSFTKAADQDLKRLKKDLEELRSLINELDDYIRNVSDDYKDMIRSTDDDLTSQTDQMADNMDILADGLKASDQVIRDQLDTMVSQLQLINESLQSGFDEMKDEINKLKDTDALEDIYEDISDQSEIDPSLPGIVMNCTNRGTINSDINGGGISGCINIDLEVQFDFDPVSEGSVSLNYDRTQKAIFYECINHAPVIVKNSYAGGIVGRANMGALLTCENYGLIETKDGDYTGGIAGRSDHVIRGCYSMASFSGNNYIGGIAGQGSQLSDNVAMIGIMGDTGEKQGSIAGDLEAEGSASGNIFVSDVPAINGLTYTSQAQETTYEQLRHRSGLPNEFHSLHVTFVVDGEVLKKIPVAYGSSLSEDQIPTLPLRDGKFGIWETTDLSNIRQNIVVNANYIAWTTTIASPEPLPVVLVSGQFYNNTELTYSIDREAPSPSLDGYTDLAAYTCTIRSDYGIPKSKNEFYEVHFLASDYDSIAEIALADESGQRLTLTDTKKDGKYLVFSVPAAASFTFHVVRSDLRYYLPVIGIILGVLLLVLLCAGIAFYRKKNHPSKENKKDRKQPKKKPAKKKRMHKKEPSSQTPSDQ